MPNINEVLSAYVPMERRQALVTGNALSERTKGAVLFADISGFTPLTSALTKELGAERGVEMLSDQLNQVYGALIDKVHQYQGSVISFAGDAITCWFDQDEGSVATAAAFAMQQVMDRFSAVITPGNSAIPFGIKVAVAAGEVSRLLVGHPRIMTIDVLAGELMDRVAEAGELVEQDEIVVGEEIVKALRLIKVAEWRTGESEQKVALITTPPPLSPRKSWPTLPPLPQENSRNWLLPPVYQRLNQGLGDFLAELRPAVALFAKFSGLDYDKDPEAGEKLNQYIQWVQTVLSNYEGYLLQVIMGDKGSHFYALFGAPIAHENDEARAVAAALELQNRPESLSFIEAMQIGISQGPMYVGAYGSYNRRTYSGLGDQVNMAARLMSQAVPGAVLVSEAVKKTAVRFNYTSQGMIKFKGIDAPQEAFSVTEARFAQPEAHLKGRDMVAMVGRTSEREILKSHLAALLNGRSSQLIIEGEAGIGKSRLVADLQAQARELGVAYLLGAGDAIEQNTPYHAWRGVFRGLFDISDGDDDALILEKVTNRLPDALKERAPLLNAVLPLHLPDNELTAQFTGDIRAENTRDLLSSALLQTVRATSTFFIILEDGHWFDSASWALMEVVRKSLSPLMLVLVTRPLMSNAARNGLAQLNAPPEYRRLQEDEATAHLTLTALSPSEATQLVCHRLQVDSIPDTIAQIIQERADGHPFFSEELAYALRDSGMIKVENGRLQLDAPQAAFQSLDFPDTIQGVITSRIDRLAPAQQLTLKVASVIGRVFLYQALHDIHPVSDDKPRLINYLDHLDQLGITSLETPAPEMSYIFKHVTIQEVAYSLLLFAQRQQLHQITAEWLERTNQIDLVPHYPLLAHHWSRAEIPEKAIVYLEKAGQEAFRNGAFREVLDFINQAVALAETLPANRDSFVLDDYRRAEWQILLGDAHFGLGQLIESRQYFLKALALLGWPMPEAPLSKTISNLLLQFGNYFWLVTIPEKVRFFFRKPTAEMSKRRLAAAHVYEPLGLVYYFSSETQQAMYTALHRFILAKKANEATSELSRGYASVCGIFMIIGFHRLGMEYGRQARRIARELNDLPALAWALLSTGVFSIGVDAWENVERRLKEGVALSERILDKRTMGDTIATLLNVLHAQDKYEEAFIVSKKLEEAGVDSGNKEHVAWGITGQANSRLKMGYIDEAISFYQRSLKIFEEVPEDYVHEAETLGMLGAAYLYQGNLREAEAQVERAAALIPDQIPSSYVLFPAFSAIADVYLTRLEREGMNTAVQAKAEKALQDLARFARHHPIGLARSHILQGRYAVIQGRTARAEKRWRKAVKVAEQKGMRFDQGLVHLMMGKYLNRSDAVRQQNLLYAKEKFEAIGAVLETAVVEQLLNI